MLIWKQMIIQETEINIYLFVCQFQKRCAGELTLLVSREFYWHCYHCYNAQYLFFEPNTVSAVTHAEDGSFSPGEKGSLTPAMQ